MFVIRSGLFVLLTVCIACAAVSVQPSSRFKITEQFPNRPGGVKVTGIEVRSTLSDDILSDEDLEKLASFFCADLRKTTIGTYINLNAGATEKYATLILTIDISHAYAATSEERGKRIPSYLHGTISMYRVATGKSLGRAKIWARGSSLSLEANHSPNTVREFAEVVRYIVH